MRVKDGPWYLLRVRPYKTWEDKIEGAVLSFQDIDSLKRTLGSDAHFRRGAHRKCARIDPGSGRRFARHAWRIRCFTEPFKSRPRRRGDASSTNSATVSGISRSCANCFTKITTHNTRIDGYEVRHKFQHLGLRHMILNARRIEPQGGTQMILLSIEDVPHSEKGIADRLRASPTRAHRDEASPG